MVAGAKESAGGGQGSWIHWLLSLDPPEEGEGEVQVEAGVVREGAEEVGGGDVVRFGNSLEDLSADLNGEFWPLESFASGLSSDERGFGGNAAGVVGGAARLQGDVDLGFANARAACVRRGEVVWESWEGSVARGGRRALASLIGCWGAACAQTMT